MSSFTVYSVLAWTRDTVFCTDMAMFTGNNKYLTTIKIKINYSSVRNQNISQISLAVEKKNK